MLSIEVYGIESLVAKFGNGARPVISRTMRAVGEKLVSYLAHYPGRVHYPIQWVSEAQRRAYWATRRGVSDDSTFWAVKGGLGPYRRNTDPYSERLGPSWAVEQRDDLGAIVGTRVSYAPWVQSAEHQQPMHANTGWITDEQAVAKLQNSGAIERIIRDAMKQEDW